MNPVKKWIKKLRCKHQNKRCITNFYGDYINHISTSNKTIRSAWECKDCGKIIYSEQLDPKCIVVNWSIRLERE